MKLSTVMELAEQIRATQAELEELKARAESATTSRLDGLPRAKSYSSRIESLIVKISDRERRLANLVEESACAQIDLTLEILDRVTGKAGEVIYQRYILCRPFAEIAAAMHYSESQIRRLHSNGRRAFESKINLT